MNISYFLAILLHLWIVQAKYNITSKDDIAHNPRAGQPTEEPERPVWYYFPIAIGVLGLTAFAVVLYINGKRRAARRRRRRAERSAMHISVPVEGTLSSLMGNAAVDFIAVNACTTGRPQLKAKMLQTFNEEEGFGSSLEDSFNDDDDYDAPDTLEDYVNTKSLDYGQDSCAMVSLPNLKGKQGIQNTNAQNIAPGRIDCAALKKTPFIPPAISVELVRKQTEKESQIERGNRKKSHGSLSPDWGRGKEESMYENQNSASLLKSRDQPLYVNNSQVKRKKGKSGEGFNKTQHIPELPLKQKQKQKLRRADGFGAQTQTWAKGKSSSDYENFFGGDSMGGSCPRDAMYRKNKNKAYSQGAKGNNLKDGEDYENVPSVGGNLLPRKTQEMSASCGSKIEFRRKGPGFSREDHKALRRSRTNVEAMLQLPGYGQGVEESKENLVNENHQTNTESLMHMLGLPVNPLTSPDHQEQTFEDDNYVPMDDYDDNQA